MLSKINVTDATLRGFLDFEPEKMTSVILSVPRKDLTDCSPSTHLTASTTLLLPEPLGPTIPVIPLSKSISIVSAKDLKPCVFICFKYISSP